MAESFTTEIHLGGCIPLRQVAKLCHVIHEAHVELDWGSGRFSPQGPSDLLDNRHFTADMPVLRLCDDQACWGEFPELEQFLVRHQIPFDRFTDGKWEYAPQWLAYRPGAGLRALETNTAKEPIIPITGLDQVCARLIEMGEALKQGNHHAALKQNRSALRSLKRLLPAPIPTLPAFDIAPTLSRDRRTTSAAPQCA